MITLACLDPACPIETPASLEQFVAFARQLMDFQDIGWWCIHYELDPEHFYCNAAMCEMFALPDDSLRHPIATTCPIAGDFNHHVAEVDRAVADKILADYRALLDGETEAYDNVFPFSDPCGHVRYFRSQARVLQRGNDGQPTLIHGLLMEITAEVELQHQLQADKLHFKRLAQLDGLTGLFNRNTMLTLCEEGLQQARRHDRPLALWYLDLDHFKQVNDEAGHAEGDRVLRDFSRLLKQFFNRPDDLIGRLGGEEFLVCTRGPDMAALQAMKQRFQAQLQATAIPTGREQQPALTVSGGIVWMDPLQIHCDLETLLQQADELLYQAKKEGRNRLKLAQARC